MTDIPIAPQLPVRISRRHRIADGVSITLTAPGEAEMNSFLAQLYGTTTDYVGGIWELIGSAIANGIDWPDWWNSYITDCSKYESALEGKPFLSALKGTLAKTALKAEMWRRNELCFRRDLGLRHTEDVHLPDFFETSSFVGADRVFSGLAQLAHGLRGLFVIKCFPRQRLHESDAIDIANEHFWQENDDALRAAGLVSAGDGIPLDAMVPALPLNALKAILKAHGAKPTSIRVANENMLLALASRQPGTVDEIRSAVVKPNTRCKMPPAGLSWEDFQSYRWQIRGIAGTLFEVAENPRRLSHFIDFA